MDPSKAISSPMRRSRSSKEISRSRSSRGRSLKRSKSSEAIASSLKRPKSSEAISSSRFFLRDSCWRCLICHLDFESIDLSHQHKEKEHHHVFERKASKLSSVETGQEDEDKKIDNEEEKIRCWRCTFCLLNFASSELLYQHQKKEHDHLFQRKASKLSSVETGQEDEDKKIDDEEENKRCCTCPFCLSEFESLALFYQHQKEEHDHLYQRKGSKLEMKFLSVETGQVDEDKKIDAEEKKKRNLSWECKVCHLCLKSEKDLDQHKKKLHHPLRQKASMSSVETRQEDEDKKKIDDEEWKKRISFECSICKLVFGPEDFAEHRRELHPSDLREISQPFVATWQEDDDEYKKYQEKGWKSWMRCQFCQKPFPSSKALDHHISFEHHPSLLAITPAAKTEPQKRDDVDVDVDNAEEEEFIWLGNESQIYVLRMFAQIALEHYNNQNPGKRYVVVAHGPNVTTGTLDHINFKAKKEDCPDAPVETFFAQLTIAPYLKVDCCVSLGPSRSLPSRRKGVELNGCRFCSIINHPRETVANLILDPSSGRRNF